MAVSPGLSSSFGQALGWGCGRSRLGGLLVSRPNWRTHVALGRRAQSFTVWASPRWLVFLNIRAIGQVDDLRVQEVAPAPFRH